MFGREAKYEPSDPKNGFTNYDAVRRQIHRNLDKIRVIKRGIPNTERISDDEVYLLNETGKRHRRICGAPKKGLPAGYVCLQAAGYQTIHPNFGRCKFHDHRQNGNEQYTFRKLLDEVIAKNPDQSDLVARTLLDYEKVLPDIDARLDDLTQELRTLYGMLAYTLNRPDTQLGTKGFIRSVNELVANIVKLKKTQKDIDLANNYIALTDLNRFLDQLFAVVGEICGRTKASEVFSRVKETIILGYNPNAFKKLTMNPDTSFGEDIQEAEEVT